MEYSSSSQKITWHTRVLLPATRQALEYLSGKRWLKQSEWYLAGGTALALQVGHRSSVDLDFFLPQKSFQLEHLIAHFPEKIWHTDIAREGTVYGKLHGAKVSFIAYPFFAVREPYLWHGNVRVIDRKDIAVMKIIAISQRGRKRDFVDLYWYCKNAEPLSEVVSRVTDQYPNIAHDFYHILKSLTYFADAEADPMPRLFFEISWPAIKKFFRTETAKAAKKILRLS